MDLQQIAALLEPFVISPSLSSRKGGSPEEPTVLTQVQLQQIANYLDLLLRWNSRINLTAVREPEEIVTRHFGESLFAARNLFPSARQSGNEPLSFPQWSGLSEHPRVFDFGSGAGFPGLPIKIWAPPIELTLIESNQKKATFLREVIRTLSLASAVVFLGRSQNFSRQADVVTLRAVERFESSVAVAAGMVGLQGKLALLIGQAQAMRARELVANFRWQEPVPIPMSSNRILLIGHSKSPTNQTG